MEPKIAEWKPYPKDLFILEQLGIFVRFLIPSGFACGVVFARTEHPWAVGAAIALVLFALAAGLFAINFKLSSWHLDSLKKQMSGSPIRVDVVLSSEENQVGRGSGWLSIDRGMCRFRSLTLSFCIHANRIRRIDSDPVATPLHPYTFLLEVEPFRWILAVRSGGSYMNPSELVVWGDDLIALLEAESHVESDEPECLPPTKPNPGFGRLYSVTWWVISAVLLIIPACTAWPAYHSTEPSRTFASAFGVAVMVQTIWNGIQTTRQMDSSKRS